MNKTIIIFFLILLVTPIISAETDFFVKRSDFYDLKINAVIDGSRLSSSGTCNITISYPNATIMVDDAVMTNLNNGFFNYTLNSTQTTPNGEYTARAECIDSNINGTSTFIYEVNPTGIRPSDQKSSAINRGIWYPFIIASLLFLAFLFVKADVPVKWTFFGISVIFFLISLNILFVDLQDQVVNPALESFFDGFTAISWIFYWFVGGLLIIMWAFTFLNTWLFKKNLEATRRFS